VNVRAGFLSPLVAEPRKTFVLRNCRTGQLLATAVEPAFDSERRRRGLLGREGLPDGAALIIAPSNAVHTFFMKFQIDVIFVRRDGRVLKVRQDMPARRVAAALTAFAVIETAAGGAGRAGVQPGDRIALESSESEQP
jgi:uncharacterized membrane protein (UPF0127 family)